MSRYTFYILAAIILTLSADLKGENKESEKKSLYAKLEADTTSARSKVKILNRLIKVLGYTNEESERLLYQADSICINNRLHYWRGKTYFLWSIRYNRLLQLDSTCTHVIDMIDSMARLATDPKELLLLHNSAYSTYTLNKQDYAASEGYVRKAIRVADSLDFKDKLPNLYSELGLRQRLQFKYFEAIESYFKALDLGYVRTSYCYSNLGKIYGEIFDYENQLLYSEKGRAAAIIDKRPGVQITCRMDKAKAMYNLGQLDSAEIYLLETMPLIKKSRYKSRARIVNETLARIYFDRKEWSKLADLESSFHNYKEDAYHSMFYALLGHSYIDRGKYHQAKTYCEKAYNLGEADKENNTNNHKYYLLDACNCLATVYENEGRYQKALEITTEARKIDSFLNDKKKIISISQALNKKDLKQQKELIVLSQSKKEQQAKIELFRTRLITAFILILSLIGLFAYLKLREKNSKISKQNSIIKQALAEKNILLKEIHHRVKNNLQVISSLFSMQMRHSSDDLTKRILSDGKNRIRSIALIHQSLYQTDNISKISFKGYLTNLTKNLYSAFEIDDTDIRLEMDVGDIYLELETMISLGLVLNELISNCFKHAFKETKTGLITVRLDEIDNQLILEVQDNGKGMVADRFNKKSSFGNKLVTAFSKKLKAELSVEEGNGTTVTMIINNYKKTA